MSLPSFCTPCDIITFCGSKDTVQNDSFGRYQTHETDVQDAEECSQEYSLEESSQERSTSKYHSKREHMHNISQNVN